MGYVLSCGSTVRAAAHIHDSHSHTPCNSKSTQILWNLPHVRAQSHATKRYLAVERPQVTRVERIGPVLFCAACSCVAANHSSDISRHKLLTKWRTAWSPILKARNRQEYTPPCVIQYGTRTSMGISAKPIAAAMRKGLGDKCEVVGQDSFASPTGCRLSTVPRSGELRTQKLKSHLVRTQSLNVLPLKPGVGQYIACLLYTSPSPRDPAGSRMPSSA